jgi:heat shock protein HspQ
MESMQLLLNNVIQLFNQYSNKKSYYNKNLQKINAYKSYIDLIDYIKGKYKSKKFSLEKLIEYYKKTTSNKEGKFKRKEKRKSTLGNTFYNANFGINRILKHNEFDFNKIYEDKDNTYASKTSFPKIIPEERKNKSFSHISSRRTSFSEICGFNEISSQNDSEENEAINKKNYQNFEKIKSQKIPNFKFPITMNKPQNSEKSFENTIISNNFYKSFFIIQYI